MSKRGSVSCKTKNREGKREREISRRRKRKEWVNKKKVMPAEKGG